MKLWVDDVRPAPDGYMWCKSVTAAISCVQMLERAVEGYNWELNTFKELVVRENVLDKIDYFTIELIDIDHDAGDYANDGGDYIKLLDWLEETGRNYPIRIHSMNPVGVANMRAIIKRNGWKEVM